VGRALLNGRTMGKVEIPQVEKRRWASFCIASVYMIVCVRRSNWVEVPHGMSYKI